MVGPDAFMEVRYLMHAKQRLALDLIPRIADEFAAAFGRDSGGLVRGVPARRRRDGRRRARLGARHASRIVVDARRARGRAARRARDPVLPPRTARRRSARPSRDARRVVVVEKAFAVGAGGIVGQDVRLALHGTGVPVHDVIAGLGGRPVTAEALDAGGHDEPGPASSAELTFLDLRRDVAERELARLPGAVA